MDYEIRAMSFGEILDTGFQLVRNHFGLLTGIAAVLYVPMAILNAYLGPALQDPSAGAIGPMIAAGVGLVLLALVVSPIVQVASTHAIGEVYVGRGATIGAALRFGVSILLPLAGTALLMYLAFGLGPLVGGGLVGGAIALAASALGVAVLRYLAIGAGALVAGGILIYLVLSFLLVWQVMVLERTFGVAALRRSRELMRGHLLRGLGIVAVSSLVILVLVGALGFVFGLVPWLGPVGSGVAQAAGAAYGAAVAVALYFDIRCRKEAFEVEHLAQQVAARSPVAGA